MFRLLTWAALLAILFGSASPSVDAGRFQASDEDTLYTSGEGFGQGRPAQARYSDTVRGFSFRVPPGFEESPELRSEVSALYAFLSPSPDERQLPMAITLQPMAGVIGREPITIKDAAGHPAESYSSHWKDFEIQVVALPESIQGRAALALLAQVPLKPAAIQIAVLGEAGRRLELMGVLKTVLDSLEGPSNWLSDEQRAELAGELVGRILVFAGMGGALLWWWRRRKRRQRQ